jgi:predicted CoA-binding protein
MTSENGAAAVVNTQLANGLTAAVPADSPRARLLHSERTWLGPTAKERLRILRRARSIAIVGFSTNPARASYFVGTYLVQSTDYTVYLVNPNAAGRSVLGQPVYAALADLPETPDIVDVFRKAADIPGVVAETTALTSPDEPSPVLWIQLGLWNERAAYDAEANGLTVVMDRCLKIEHARFHGGLHLLGFDTGQITARKTVR